MKDGSSINVQDSVYSGDTYNGTVVNQQNYIQNIIIDTQENSVLPNSARLREIVKSPVKPSKQIWFMGKRIWTPQTNLISFSLICILFLPLFIEPFLMLLIGNLMAVLAIKKGDFRGIFPLIIGLLLFTLIIIY